MKINHPEVRSRLEKQPGGNRAFVELLLLARQLGLETLEVACELALEEGIIQGSVLLNAMRRLSEPLRPKALDGALDATLSRTRQGWPVVWLISPRVNQTSGSG